MIEQACPVIVLDDDRNELWSVSHGLGLCGLPVMPHLVQEGGTLERIPETPYSGVRLLFTDLHLLGPTQSKPEQYIAALASFIKRLVQPSIYVVVFWSNYVEEAEEAWALLSSRIDQNLRPFGYKALSKELAKNACDDEPEVAASAQIELRNALDQALSGFPHLRALMAWETSVSKAASETTNSLLNILPKGNASLENASHVRAVLARMAQEALGYPYAPLAAAKGLTQALLPIMQDWLERRASDTEEVTNFLAITEQNKISLPSAQLNALLNNFFIHAEGDVNGPLDRGAVIQLEKAYLESPEGFTKDFGLMDSAADWREAICSEFHINWRSQKEQDAAKAAKAALAPESVVAIELSAVCDHAQDKQRTQRFLLGLFVPASLKGFSGKSTLANEAIYATPEITLNGISGQLLVSCRIFSSRPYRQNISGKPITRLRKDVVDELSHHYATHMRRPGKIAFYG